MDEPHERITVSYAAGLIINTIHSPFNSHIDVVEPESFGKMDWHLRSGHDPCMLKPIPDSCCTFSRVMGFIRAEKQHWHADRKKCTDSDKSGDIKCEDAPRKLSKPEVVLKRWTAAASPVQRGRPELTPQDPV
ncbi:hypothetical protein F2P81_003254 [Scophthalmus maximus]|uniref:Uncharacterized protein n=1 Tax=Scophthalmus maximus TaxID=52904 RepID=A0A6A4T954_SCOMX|nr:hypothetical protein F2P81_003254 [Scophthalmus maximus]